MKNFKIIAIGAHSTSLDRVRLKASELLNQKTEQLHMKNKIGLGTMMMMATALGADMPNLESPSSSFYRKSHKTTSGTNRKKIKASRKANVQRQIRARKKK